MKQLLIINGLLLCLLPISGKGIAAASCTSSGGGNWTVSGKLIYQRDQAIGTWGSNKFTTTNAYSFGCTADKNADRDAYLTLKVSGSPITGYTDVYPTNVTSVGVRYNFALNSGSFCPVKFDDHIINSSRNYTCHILAGTSPALSFGASLEFVKITDQITSAKITTIPSVNVSYSLNNEVGTWNLPIMWTGGTTIDLVSVTCSLTSTSINVPLGDTLVSKFTGIATTAGDKAFDVGLSCDKDAKINVSLAGTQNTDTSETSVLALTSAGQTGTASGVGVQLLYGGTPLKINNNILLKTSLGGQETLPFTARYYQTLTDVGVGLANSSATLNITYQ